MKKIFKGLGFVLIALLLVVGVGAGSANATLTVAANALTETGALTISSSAITGALVIGTSSMTSGVTTIYGGTAADVGIASAISLTPGTAGTIVIGAVDGTGLITLGTSTGAQQIDIGGGVSGIKRVDIVPDGATNNIVNIATGAKKATVTIGNVTGATAVVLNAGTGASKFLVTGVGTLTLGKVDATGAVVVYGGTSAANTLFDNVTGGTIAIGTANTGGISIGSGTAINTINIGIGNAVKTIHIGDDASPANAITIGGTASGTTIAGTLAVTGVLTATPAVVLTAGINGKVIFAGTETIAAGGTTTALALTKEVHYIDADAGGDIFTLADGVEGQIMSIVMASATGIATITPPNLRGGTSVTLNAVGETVILQFVAAKWSIMGGNGYTVI